MSDDFGTAEKVVEEVLIDLMIERVMLERGLSTGVQESSTRFQTSPSTALAVPSQPTDERQTKHRDDIANANLIPCILPTYLPPLSDAINRDSVPRDFKYTLITTYLRKGVCIVCADQDKLIALKFSDFNIGDCKFYSMLALYKYLTRTKGNNYNIFPQSWTQNLMQSTLLNVMRSCTLVDTRNSMHASRYYYPSTMEDTYG